MDSLGSPVCHGDAATRKQYRSIESFSTDALPDNAAISYTQLKLKLCTIIPPGSDPINLMQGILVDIKK